jgi:hypothetical protein
MGRLMLEPPKAMPREVEQELADDRVRAARVNAMGGLVAVIGGLALTPLLWWMADGYSPWVIALIAVMVVMGIVSIYNLKAKTPITGLVVIGNAVMIGMIACGYSPLLVAPGLAAVLTMAMVFTPRFSWLGSGVSVAVSALLAVFVPLLLEHVGVLERTMFVEPDRLVIRAPSIGGDPTGVIAASATYAAILILLAAWIAELMRTRTRDAHRHLLLQAWQLKQLVPRPATS